MVDSGIIDRRIISLVGYSCGTRQYLSAGRLNTVLNSAARLVYSRRMSEYMTYCFKNCTGHASWGNPVPAVCFFRTIVHGPARRRQSRNRCSSLSTLVRSVNTMTMLVWCHQLVGQCSVTACFPYLQRGRGTVFFTTNHQYSHSSSRSSLTFSVSHKYGRLKSGAVRAD